MMERKLMPLLRQTHMARFSLEKLGKSFRRRGNDGYKIFLELTYAQAILAGLKKIVFQ